MKNVDKINLFKKVGQALYGESWQADMVTALGLGNARRIRQWLSQDKPIPEGVWKDLHALLEDRKSDIELLLKEIRLLEEGVAGE